MRVAKLIAGLAVAATLTAPEAQAAGLSQADIAAFEAAFERCFNNFPDRTAVRKAHKKAKMKFEGRGGNSDFFTARGGDVFTFVGDKKVPCGFGVDGLREGNAVAVTEKMLKRVTKGQMIRLKTQNRKRTLGAWRILANGETAVVIVSRIVNFPRLYRGSLILVRRDDYK